VPERQSDRSSSHSWLIGGSAFSTRLFLRWEGKHRPQPPEAEHHNGAVPAAPRESARRPGNLSRALWAPRALTLPGRHCCVHGGLSRFRNGRELPFQPWWTSPYRRKRRQVQPPARTGPCVLTTRRASSVGPAGQRLAQEETAAVEAARAAAATGGGGGDRSACRTRRPAHGGSPAPVASWRAGSLVRVGGSGTVASRTEPHPRLAG
jgi:hypothetical protein